MINPIEKDIEALVIPASKEQLEAIRGRIVSGYTLEKAIEVVCCLKEGSLDKRSFTLKYVPGLDNDTETKPSAALEGPYR
jgi:hypothetical protein